MKLKKFLSIILSRNAAFVLLLLMQIAFLGVLVYGLRERFYMVYFILIAIDIVLAVFIMNKKEPPAYKLSWIVMISVFPILGGVFYLFLKSSERFPKTIDRVYQEKVKDILVQDEDVAAELEELCPDSANLARYVANYGLYPVYRNCEAEYFKLGEDQFSALIEELEKAEKYIFMEYFIISKGYMFDTISEIMMRKAKQGVDVRLIYDGIGTGMLNSKKIFDKLIENGVQCREFNSFRPMMSSVQNNRDHRKIVVIDGNTAFNGGANLADEYINRKERFGHWKDVAVMVRGEAVRNYLVMFLELWSIVGLEEYNEISERTLYLPNIPTGGFVQPFSDSPLDDEPVGKHVYMEMICNAREYVCITTPYLILDDEMINVLTFAAKKGVDVRVIVPHIPDKWYVYMIAWNNYPKLISEGVKVYEYTPGFIHAKTCIADGKTAVVGTINLDYRSFYLHYESASIFYDCEIAGVIKQDFDDTMSKSHLVTMEDVRKRPIHKKIIGLILNIFAPLL